MLFSTTNKNITTAAAMSSEILSLITDLDTPRHKN
jgi:hypothetical protein